ncbi:phenylacetate--CoA ligase family protein [Methanococcoides methylutens]|uniref:Phenylacetate-coenzyme A ligase n=1 Tax=Methanococcoides methylutens MM1 TaxID=1434104 RepID=A0A0E3SSS9_METMT|nr:AMP-binding protein [Methanococcoides methylutens]AKB85668.1 Phenylacetate-coenzyme A ligase [Methanococcoides methylutens MM1]
MNLPEKISTSIKMNVAKRKLDSRKIKSTHGNPLEQWGVAKIKKEIAKDKELKKLFGDKDLNREDIKAYKLLKLKELVDYVSKNSPYYKELYAEHGLDSSQINSYEDLAKIPLTEQDKLAAHPYHFLCVSRKDIAREFTSSGTTNMLKRVAYTQGELLEIVDSVISGLKMAGMDSNEDTLQIMYPTITATWDPGLVLSKACDLGGFRSVINNSIDAQSQLDTIKEKGTTLIIGTSSFIYNFTIEANKIENVRDLGIKKIICSSEPLTDTMRMVIESVWGCKAVRQWGMTELGLANAIECEGQDGLHVNNPDFLIEVIDPKTSEILPPGEEGELVVTTLRRKCMPLIRYRTRDISAIYDEKCNCGAHLDQRIMNVKRMDDYSSKN